MLTLVYAWIAVHRGVFIKQKPINMKRVLPTNNNYGYICIFFSNTAVDDDDRDDG